MRPRKRREEKPIQDREKLVVDMLPLVKRVALKIRKRLPAHVEMDDLLSDGVVGLVDAVAKFDPRKRVKLESYARHRIRGSILDGLRGADPVPRDLRRKHRKTSKSSIRNWRPSSAALSRTRRWLRGWEWIWRNGTGTERDSECGVLTVVRAPFQRVRPSCRRRRLSRRFWRVTIPMLSTSAIFANSARILALSLSQLRERERQIITLYYQRGANDEGDCHSYEGGRIARLAASCGGPGPIEGEGGFLVTPRPS